MKSPKVLAAGAAGLMALSLGLSACGGGDDDDDKKTNGATGKFNAGAEAVVNASDKKGGVLKLASTDDFDSTDPGNTYYAWVLNFSRLYARPLMTYKPKPGKEGTELIPDIAEAPGVGTDGNKTWTYKLKKGLKFEDGTEIKAKDVKYAVARTFDRGILGKGPTWFPQLLDAKGYEGPYKDKNLDNFKAVQTPDDYTVVFKTASAVPEFNYVAALPQTAPVPQAKDKGAQYLLHPVSSGPYMWEGNFQPKKGGNLVRNPNWDPSTDQARKQLPDRIEFSAGVAADELDQRLINGTVHVDVAGTGVQAAARQKILTSPSLKGNADNAYSGFSWFVPINTKLIPNVECRKAIIYAADRDAMWRAYGADAGGDMSTGIIPPNIAAHKDITDLYPAKPGYKGDPVKAKEALTKCGKPSGFSTNVAYRSDRPKEKLVVEALEQSLGKVGIKLQIKGYPSGTYTSEQFGSPAFNKKENIGMGTYGWAADWPTGYGYLQPITDSRAIAKTGNTNMAELSVKQVDDLWNQAAEAKDTTARDTLAAQADRAALEQAAHIPNVYAKSLMFRPTTLTNVFLQQYYGMYDYTQLGVTG